MAVRLIAAILIAGAAPAFAQTKPAPLTTEADKPFKHENSGITLPVTLLGFPRKEGQEYVKPQLDVAFRYFPADSSEEVSVYIYRVNTGVPALWFDVSSSSVEQRASFGRKTRFEMPLTFTPPGQATASGLKAAWTLSDAPYRSTALAMVPVGEWLVKIRYSATTLETASLARRLEDVIAAIGWPGKIKPSPAAAAIADCTSPLKLNGTSKPVKPDGASALMDALMVAAVRDKKGKEEAKEAAPVAWCRDRAVKAPAPVYRPAESDNSYLLAFTDSGQAVWTQPSPSTLFGIGKDGKDGKESWSVSVVLPGETINYLGRDRLPEPAEIGKIIGGQVTSRVSTWGKSTLTLDSATFK